ncbi:MAG TPA: ribosome small subunit-dependent GTPase A [Propionibacteriaceae bacterium]|nr:ribosome small subunit-dependent GTPase A [Propionibacteriaceae bacterium]
MDDHEGYDRPGKQSRPRTKDRPDYTDAPLGRIITVDRGRYRCAVDGHMVSATKSRQLGRKGVIIGDLVRLDGDTSGDEGTLARIVEVTERTTVLRRTADDNDPFERPVVANADQLMIVTALADPPPRVGMIDRIMVAGFEAGIEPILCLTKADLASPDALIAAYDPLGVPVVVTEPGAELESVHDVLRDHVTVLVGHSGVGKSTLVNALIPGVNRAIGVVNDVTGRGRHTSTSAIALELPGGGWVIDTPGIRSFGLSHVTPEKVLAAFGDLEDYTGACPRGCTHDTASPECGLDLAAAKGELAIARLTSFRRIIEALSTLP